MQPGRSLAFAGATLAVLTALASPAAAQQSGPPADTVRTGSLGALTLESGVDSTMTYTVRDGVRRPMMLYVETVTETPEGILVVGENIRPDGRSVTLDSVLVERNTLAPVRHADVTPAGRTSVRFEGGRVTGMAVDSAGRETPVDAVATPGAFDYSITGRVVAALPLAAGYAAVVLTHDIRRGAIPLTIRVLGEEEITSGSATRDAWKVEVDYGRFKAIRWIDKATRRELRTTVKFGDTEMIVEPVQPS